MTKRSLLAGVATAVFAAGTIAATAPAQAEFPERPVEMTVLFGGTAQTIGQLLADLMSKELSEPVVPVGRQGGGGSVGYQYVHGTAADGYNIVWNSNSISTGHHGGQFPFDYTAFAPIAKVSVEVPALAVRADSGWETLAEMAEAVKASGQKLKVGASGKGSFTHLTTSAMLDAVGLSDSAIHVPYDQGRAPVELLAGRLDAAIQWPGQFASHHEAGTLRILCVTSAKRISQMPEVPTCAESGAPGMDIVMWRGLVAPAGTPVEVIEKLQGAAQRAAETEEFRKAAETIGFEIDFADHAAFGELMARDDAMIADLMISLGMKAQ